MKWMDELTETYQKNKPLILGLSGLGLVMIICLYLYHQAQQPREANHAAE